MNFDLRYALRRLIRARGFTLAASLTIALGVGANTAIFSLVNALLLRPPVAVTEPERLVGAVHERLQRAAIRGVLVRRHRRTSTTQATDVFTGVMGFSPAASRRRVRRQPRACRGRESSPTTISRCSARRPSRGRGFGPEQRVQGGEPVAVISYSLWQRRFGGDPAIVGKPLRMNAREFTIIGVAPAGFSGSLRGLVVDVWVPASIGAYVGMGADAFTSRGDRGAFVYARLKPGVTIEQAQARMSVVARQLTAAYPGNWTDVTQEGPAHHAAPRARDAHPAAGTRAGARLRRAAHGDCRSRAARVLRECRWSAARARRRAGSRKSASASRSAPAAGGSSGRC